MKNFARRVAAAAALVAGPVLVLAAPVFASEAQAAPLAKSAADMAADQTQIVTLTNAQRVAHGCKALHIDARLITAARAHSADMARTGSFSHTGTDGSSFVTREARAGYPSRSASAENIAWGYRTPQDVVSAWMKSPGHRANILNCTSQAVGVGVAYTSGGAPYWTQDFGRN